MPNHSPAAPAPEAFVAKLLHRWFVQYNPSYLLSAVLFLVGLTLVSRGLAHDSSAWGMIAVGAASELYAVALIGGAALLTRIDMPRPAVFVALIAVVYQGDLALGTEAYALLGRLGWVASLAWLLLFVAKLRGLAWALRLELTSSALAVPSFGALGIALVPHLSRWLDAHALSMVVGLWLFAVSAGALWTSRRVTRPALDGWGDTVLRRALRATWVVWATLAIGHTLFWALSYGLHLGVFGPVATLLATRWVRREAGVVACVAATLVFAAICVPEFFQLTALTSAIVLTLHALRKPSDPQPATGAPPRDDYRAGGVSPATPMEETFSPSAPAAAVRQLAWAGGALYLSAWTLSWSGGAWPLHLLPLDLIASVTAGLVAWKSRHRVVAVPFVLTWVHWSIQSRLLRAPQSTLQWGFATAGLGFALLFASLFASFRLGTRPRAVTCATGTSR